MAVHPNSLANLRPAKAGEVRNPTGVNQYSLDHQRLQRFDVTCQALIECMDPELREHLAERIARDVIAGAVSEDRQLLTRLLSGAIRGLW